MTRIWIGRIISWIISLLFAFSAVMKLAMIPAVIQGMEQLGLPLRILRPLGIIELLCVVVYLIPRTAFFGTILLTGYVGGTIITHWRVGQPPIAQIAIGVLIWIALFLRRPRLREMVLPTGSGSP
jgi:hypothetical protein